MDEPDEDAGEARQRRQSTVEEREARVQALLAAALPSPASARRASSSWAEPRRSQGGEARRSAAPRLSEPSPRRLSEARVSASSAGRRERRSSAASAARSNAWDTPRESDEGAQGGGDDTAQSAERLPEALVEAHARVAGERAELDAKLAAVQREAAALRADRDALDADRRAFEEERQQVLQALARLQEAGRATSGEFAALEAERRAVAEAHDALASERAVFEAHAAQLSAVSSEAQRASEEAARLKQEAAAAAAAAAADAAAAAELRAGLAVERRNAEEVRAEAEARCRTADARTASADALRRDVAESAAQLAAAWRALETVQRSTPATGYASFPAPHGESPPAAQAAHAAAAAVMHALRPAGDSRWRANGAGSSPAAVSSQPQPKQLVSSGDGALLADVRASLRQLELERASRNATLQSQAALLSRLRSSTGADDAPSSLHYSPAGGGARIPPMLPSPGTPASASSAAGSDKPKRKKRLAEPSHALPALAPPSPAAGASCDWPAPDFPGLRPSAAANYLGSTLQLGGSSLSLGGGNALLGDASSSSVGAGGGRKNLRSTSTTGSIAVCTGKHCKKDGAAELLAAFKKAAPPGVAVKECKCMGKCGKSPVAESVPLN